MYDIAYFLQSHIKAFFVLVLTYLATSFSHIGEAIFVLFVAFVINIFTGIAEDIHVNKSDFSLQKAFSAITQLTFYIALIFLIQSVGDRLHNNAVSEIGVKWVSYIVVYFYFTNILRNASSVFPKSEGIKFLYEIMSTKLFEKLRNFFGLK